MPPLPLLGALIDTAGSALKAGRKAAAADASAPANAADAAGSPLPFAQTLKQSVASQRTSSAQADASSTPTLPSTSSSAPSTVAGNAKPSGSSDDKARDDATAAVNPDAAALAAAAVQAQLQARPDGTPAAADAPSTDPLSRAGDAASAALAAAANATKGDAQAAAATDEPATSRDVLHAALAKLTGDANAAATPSTGAATGTAAQPALSTAAAVPATPKAPTFDKTLTDAKGALAAQQGQAQPSPTQPVQADAVKPDAAHALAATQDAAAPAGAALAAATAAAQANAPVAAAANGIAAANAHVLAPHVGTPDWTDALSQKVVFLSNAHQQSAELTLNPPDLGPLQVVLRVADNHAHALFVSQHAQVRDAVEAALPKLREAMESGGLGLGSATVSDGGFASQQQNPQPSFAGGQSARRGGGAPSGADATLDAAQPAATVATASRAGLVDTFA